MHPKDLPQALGLGQEEEGAPMKNRVHSRNENNHHSKNRKTIATYKKNNIMIVNNNHSKNQRLSVSAPTSIAISTPICTTMLASVCISKPTHVCIYIICTYTHTYRCTYHTHVHLPMHLHMHAFTYAVAPLVQAAFLRRRAWFLTGAKPRASSCSTIVMIQTCPQKNTL